MTLLRRVLYRFSPWRVLGTLLISYMAASIVWNRPAPLAWTSPTLGSQQHPIGFTSDGRMVSHDSTNLRIWSTETGELLNTFPIGHTAGFGGQLTPDGEWGVLHSDWGTPQKQLIVMSTRDGQLRYPAIQVAEYSSSTVSPNGRYVVAKIDSEQTGMPTWRIIDMANGQLLWACESAIAFSPDGLCWASLTPSPETGSIVFRALDDGRELGRSQLPDIDGGKPLRFAQWNASGLPVSYEFSASLPGVISSASATTIRTWSFPVTDYQLGEKQSEPLICTLSGDNNSVMVSMTRGGMAGQFHVTDLNASPRGKFWMFVYDWMILLRLMSASSTQQYAWQPLSAASGQRLGPPIQLQNLFFTVSEDGRWLAVSGSELQVWRLPTSSRLSWTLLAALVPWLILLGWRKPTATLTEATDSSRIELSGPT